LLIALQNSLPNHPNIAEVEWSKRFHIAARRVGFDVQDVITSDDILRLRPDCVLVTHEYSAKTTEFPPIGLNWSPPAFYADDTVRHRALLSLDGYMCGSTAIAEWLDDFCAGHGKRAIIHDRLMLPSTHDFGPAGNLPDNLAVMYAGTHWDGSRHGAIFRGIESRVPLHLYGPPKAWSGHGDRYRGSLPFDGESVIAALRSAGIALCLHKSVHREANCPSMRLFEAAAAGALIVTDDFEFPRAWFRDCVLYVDSELPAPLVVDQVASHVDWAHRNIDCAQRLARRSNALFREALTLEAMIESLPAFVDRVRTGRRMAFVDSPPPPDAPTVEYVIRVGSRPVNMLRRALECLAAQTYRPIAVTLVQFHPVDGLAALIEEYKSRFRWINVIIVPNLGNRGTCWWAGLNAVTAEFFAFLDDDDTIFPNHVALIMDEFTRDSRAGLIHSGLIRIEEEPGHYFWLPQFEGPRRSVIQESRELFAIEDEDFENFTPTKNVIGHNAWICRRSALDSTVLTDPGMAWAEDVFFLTLIADRVRFKFMPAATATWHWRSTSKDNWTLSHPADEFSATYARWRRRLQNVRLPSANRIAPPPKAADATEVVSRDVS
jgi:phosphoglycerol transferase